VVRCCESLVCVKCIKIFPFSHLYPSFPDAGSPAVRSYYLIVMLLMWRSGTAHTHIIYYRIS
jgi:hypothetical protein